MKEIELFYDTKNRRFHGFNILLKNMEEKLDDLSPVSTAIDKDFIKLVNKFRVSGNSSAHTIELRISREELEAEKEDLIYLVKVLSKAIMSLP